MGPYNVFSSDFSEVSIGSLQFNREFNRVRTAGGSTALPPAQCGSEGVRRASAPRTKGKRVSSCDAGLGGQ
jgi:hypothetical protein